MGIYDDFPSGPGYDRDLAIQFVIDSYTADLAVVDEAVDNANTLIEEQEQRQDVQDSPEALEALQEMKASVADVNAESAAEGMRPLVTYIVNAIFSQLELRTVNQFRTVTPIAETDPEGVTVIVNHEGYLKLV